MTLRDPDMVAFPDPNEIEPHAIAFAGLMFAHAAFEREISALQDVIKKTPGFGEQRRNKRRTRERSQQIVELIKLHLGNDLPQTKQIEKLLNDAIDPCKQRNLLAHGTWWCFNRRTSTIVVRGATRRDQIPPEQREYTADDIYALAVRLKTIEAELYKCRRSIEHPFPETEIFAATKAELNKPLSPIEPLLETIKSELNKLRGSIEPPANQDEIKDLHAKE